MKVTVNKVYTNLKAGSLIKGTGSGNIYIYTHEGNFIRLYDGHNVGKISDFEVMPIGTEVILTQE